DQDADPGAHDEPDRAPPATAERADEDAEADRGEERTAATHEGKKRGHVREDVHAVTLFEGRSWQPFPEEIASSSEIPFPEEVAERLSRREPARDSAELQHPIVDETRGADAGSDDCARSPPAWLP